MWWCADKRKKVAKKFKKNPQKGLTGPTLLEMGDYPVNRDLDALHNEAGITYSSIIDFK